MKKPSVAPTQAARVPECSAPTRQTIFHRDRARLSLAPWVISLGVLLVYLSFPTRNYYWDGIDFALAIENPTGLSRALIHPHHLLYNACGFFLYHVVNATGWHVRAVHILQVTNSILSALCAGLLFRLLRSASGSIFLSSLLTLLFSFSATWWKYSIDADAYVPGLFFLLVCLSLVLTARKRRPFLAALAHASSMCLHQLAVFFYPVVVLGMWRQSSQLSLRERVWPILQYSGTAACVTLAAYYLCFHLQTGRFNLPAFAVWLTTYLHGPHSYSFSFDLWHNIVYTLRGHVRLFFGGRLNWLEGLISLPVAVLIGLLLIMIVLSVVRLIQGAKEITWKAGTAPDAEGRFKSLAAICLLWAGVYLLFLFFWYPHFTPYRVFYLPALILLAGIALARYELLNTAARRQSAVMLVAAVALSNFLFFIFPLSHPQKYPPLSLALEVERAWPPGTVIYYLAHSADSKLFKYFNPSTTWRELGAGAVGVREDELEEIYRNAGTAWVETSALDYLQSSPEGAKWLAEHIREGRCYELVNHAYRIRFIQLFPRGYPAQPSETPMRMAHVSENPFK
jgi:hypothetical protein